MDYLARSPSAIVHRVMGELAKRGKGIILFHDIHAVTAKALPTVLAELKAKGFKVVHVVSEMNSDHAACLRPARRLPGRRVDITGRASTRKHACRHKAQAL